MTTALVGGFIASMILVCSGVDYKEEYMDQIIDHFNVESLGNQTYKQRYFYNDTWWEKGKGPIFFYVGNEGPLESAWKKNGFIQYIAPSHQAFILFIEHRYYGKSLPFGDASFNQSKIGWLSIEQALADYALFLTVFKKQIGAENCPVIAFGASYGGMLSAFMRFKYPNIIQGTVSASGPIYQLEGLTTSEPFYEVVTNAGCELASVGYGEFTFTTNVSETFLGRTQSLSSGIHRVLWIPEASDEWAPTLPSPYQHLGLSKIFLGTSRQHCQFISSIALQTFQRVSTECVSQVRAGFRQLQRWYNQGRAGLKHISKTYKLCRRLRSDADYDVFLRWLRSAFESAAVLDYPFPTSSLPANPVKVMCDRLEAENVPVAALKSAIDVVSNSSGNSPCYDLQKQFIFCGLPQGCGPTTQYQAFEYQGCTEMIQYGGSNGETDMFPVLPFTLETKDKECKKRWNVTPRRKWLETVYWGKEISLSSNIVFSNGDLDPWAAGGVLYNVSDSIRSIIIEGAAHHLDFWYPNPTDSQAVIDARNFEVEHIRKWIREYREKRKPSFSVKN